MAEFFEYDPLTGIRTDVDFSEYDINGNVKLIRTADVDRNLDHALRVRNEVGPDKQGIAEGWHHYAHLPPVVILKMMAKGINIFDKGDSKYYFREINEHYPWLKMTTGNEGARSAPKYFISPSLAGNDPANGGVIHGEPSRKRGD